MFLKKSGTAGYQTGLFVITLPSIPPGILTHPLGQLVYVGTNITLSVIANGTTPLNYQWRKGQSDILGANGSTYTIGNAQLSDAGNYSVIVRNSAGTVESNSAELQVVRVATERPKFEGLTWRRTAGLTASLLGQTQAVYRVQWSSDLTAWFPLSNFVARTSSTHIVDPDSKTAGRRWYRAVSP